MALDNEPTLKQKPTPWFRNIRSLPEAAGAALLGDQGPDSGAVRAAGAGGPAGAAASRKKEKGQGRPLKLCG